MKYSKSCLILLIVFSVLHSMCLGQSFADRYQIPRQLDIEHNYILSQYTAKSISITGLSNAELIKIDDEILTNIFAQRSELVTITIPTNKQPTTLLLRRVDLFQSSGVIIARNQSNDIIIEDSSVHYRGIISGQMNSTVALSVSAESIMAMVVSKKSQKILAKLHSSQDYVYYDSTDLNTQNNFECVTDDLSYTSIPPSTKTEPQVDNCIGMHLQVDYDIFSDIGDVTDTNTYITGLFNQVSALYAAESVNIRIQELVIWTTQDPYIGPSANEYLSQFQSELKGEYHGDLAHLIHYGNSGIAYVDVLCKQYWGLGVSGITRRYADVPTYSWSVEVLAHEIGHSIGSPHTHSCYWNGDNSAIDGCGVLVGADEGCDGPVPTKGTIMSYCHLVNGVGIDFNLGFGEQPGNLIRDRVFTNSCLMSCDQDPCPTVGDSCDDEDPCTSYDRIDVDCNCTGDIIDKDGDGICLAEDPDDLDRCNPLTDDSLCVEDCSEYDYYTVENSWDIWNDGGADCSRIVSSNYSYGGAYSILIRDNSVVSSSTYTDLLSAYGVVAIEVTFSFYPLSMESGEDFFLEMSTDGGSNYEIAQSWVSGFDFENKQYYHVESTITGEFTDRTRLRIRCDASSNADRIYLDNISITLCSPASHMVCDIANQPCDDNDLCTSGESYDDHCNCTGGIPTDADMDGICAALDLDDMNACIPDTNHPNCHYCPEEGDPCHDDNPCTLGESVDTDCNCTGGQYIDQDEDGYCVGEDLDDTNPCIPDNSLCTSDLCTEYNIEHFESNWGVWNDGGSDCTRISNSAFASSDAYSIRIRDNSGSSSSCTSDNIPAENSSGIIVGFSYFSISMEASEDFFLELSTNGGKTYEIVQDWISGIDFENEISYVAEVTIEGHEFTDETRLRFRCDASTNSDRIFLDDILIQLCGNTSNVVSVFESHTSSSKSHLDRYAIKQPEKLIKSIYPNPVIRGHTILLNTHPTDLNKEVHIYDLNGKLYYQYDAPGDLTDITIPTIGYQSNIYIISIRSENHQEHHKIFIK